MSPRLNASTEKAPGSPLREAGGRKIRVGEARVPPECSPDPWVRRQVRVTQREPEATLTRRPSRPQSTGHRPVRCVPRGSGGCAEPLPLSPVGGALCSPSPGTCTDTQPARDHRYTWLPPVQMASRGRCGSHWKARTGDSCSSTTNSLSFWMSQIQTAFGALSEGRGADRPTASPRRPPWPRRGPPTMHRKLGPGCVSPRRLPWPWRGPPAMHRKLGPGRTCTHRPRALRLSRGTVPSRLFMTTL